MSDRIYLEVPVIFEAEIVRPRCRNPEKVTMVALHPFEVRSGTSEDYPVAASLFVENAGRWADAPENEIMQVPYFTDNETLLRPLYFNLQGMALGIHPERVATIEVLEEVINKYMAKCDGETKQTWPLEWNKWVQELGTDFYGDKAAFREEQVPVREWLNDNRQDRIAHIQAHLDQFVMVNGVLTGPTPGPCWHVGTPPRSDQPEGANHIAVAYAHPERHFNYGLWYSPQAEDLALAHAERTAVEHNAKQEAFAAQRGTPLGKLCDFGGKLGAIEVLKPEYFPAIEPYRLLERTWRKLHEKVNDNFSSLHPNVLRAYAEVLRDKQSYSGNNDVDVERAVANIEIMKTLWLQQYPMAQDPRRFDGNHPFSDFSREIMDYRTVGLVSDPENTLRLEH
jgi:hypothetical protein